MAAQTNPMEQINQQVAKQLEQMVKLGTLGCEQAEKAYDFWFTQSVEAAKEGQKLTKDWISASRALGDEWVNAVQAGAKEFFKVFTPAA